MAEIPTQPLPPAGQKGFFEYWREWLASLSGFLQAKFELLGLETKEAAVAYGKAAGLLVMALVALVFTWIFLVLGLCAVLVTVLDWPGWVALLLAAVAHLLGAAGAVLLAKKFAQEPQFEATRAELQRDREWLRK